MSDKVNDGGPTSPSDRSVVDEWRRAMEGVTPGQWLWRGKDGGLYQEGKDGYAYSQAVLVPVYEYDSGVDTKVSDTDAAWIARCSPAGISALLDLIEAQAREVAGATPSLAAPLASASLTFCVCARLTGIRMAFRSQSPSSATKSIGVPSPPRRLRQSTAGSSSRLRPMSFAPGGSGTPMMPSAETGMLSPRRIPGPPYSASRPTISARRRFAMSGSEGRTISGLPRWSACRLTWS